MIDVVYTANFGGKDDVIEINKEEGVQYIYFTDNKNITSDSWTIVHIDVPANISPRMVARILKLQSHILFPNKTTMWVDARIELLANTKQMFESLQQNDIAVFKHPLRCCIYDEAVICKELGLDKPDAITQQMKKYLIDGYPRKNGLAETGIVIRRPTNEIKKLNELWLKELYENSIRDQISFDYCCWKLQIQYSHIPRLYIDIKKHKKEI